MHDEQKGFNPVSRMGLRAYLQRVLSFNEVSAERLSKALDSYSRVRSFDSASTAVRVRSQPTHLGKAQRFPLPAL